MVEEDIRHRVLLDFGSFAGEALRLIVPLASDFSPRVIRCVVYLAAGDLGKLQEKIKLARMDWRDVITNAEYDFDTGEQIRDFSAGFPAR